VSKATTFPVTAFTTTYGPISILPMRLALAARQNKNAFRNEAEAKCE
jgi:hypothetical protein